MTEAQERLQSYQPMHELAIGLVAEMGETAEQRVSWLLHQDVNTFGALLINVNSVARGIAEEDHGFDGEGVQAGRVGGSIPPDQEDKVMLLDELVRNSQEHAKAQIEKGEDAQTIMHEVAMAMPVVLNKLHLFENGNGRTSRFMRMVLRDGDQLAPEKTELLISKRGTEKYDTTPARPIEKALMPAMRTENGTDTCQLINDVLDQDEVSVVEDDLESLRERYPNLDRSIVKAYEDSFNFNESMRLIARNKGQNGDISLKDLLDTMANDPKAQEQFIQTYRNVRKQRVELLIEGLFGKKDIPLSEPSKGADIRRWTEYARHQKRLPELDPSTIHTIEDFQMAYMEASSPERHAVLAA